MAGDGRSSGRARGTGRLEPPRGTGALPGLPAAATARLADPPPGWLAAAIAATGLAGAALLAFALVWHQTRLELPAASYTPPRAPGLAQDGWPIYRDADRALRVPAGAAAAAEALYGSRVKDHGWPAANARRRGLLIAARGPRPPAWLGGLVAANPGALTALAEARGRAAFRVAGADQPLERTRWEDYSGLGALAIVAMRERAAADPGAALAHATDGLALGVRLLHGGGPLDAHAGDAILDGLAEAMGHEWPRLARASDAELAAFGAAIGRLVPPGDGAVWLIAGALDQLWRDAPQLAHRWRLEFERDEPTYATVLGRPIAAFEHPRARMLARAALADVGAKLLADRRRGKAWPADAKELEPFRSHAWQFVQLSASSEASTSTTVMSAMGIGAVSLALHADEWGAYMLADALARELPAVKDRDFDAVVHLDALRLRAAIERHRRRHGAPPATLEALVPAFLAAMPRDPYAPSRPYRWAAGRLWSVGPDGKAGGRKADDLRLL